MSEDSMHDKVLDCSLRLFKSNIKEVTPDSVVSMSVGSGRELKFKLPSDQANIAQELEKLRKEHQDLNDLLASDNYKADTLTMQRLKKHKLWLKDKISGLESLLYPDIIA